MPRLVMTLLAVVLLLSSGQLWMRPLTFDEYAAWTAWTWRTSGASEIWRKGFVPLGDLSAMSQEVYKQIEHDEEFGWVVAGPLPAPPAEAQVRWDDGSTMRVPVIGPRKALQALFHWPEEYTFPDGEAYKLTSATYTTMRLETLRGMATVPAWRLHFSNLPGPIDYVAVDQDAVGTVEDAVEERVSGEGITDFKVLDERTVWVSYDYGSCGGEPLDVRTRVSEKPDVVVLGIDVPYRGSGGPCAGVGLSGHDVISLDQPLGDRVVLDVASGLPVMCHRAPYACHSSDP
ncbi:hypothetical protein AB0L53_41995 [Nonomuraea sp. NPDC052129]|uniref:hypothetical protein n=1 Tax=Nonomuraea sp. NPDC052129 TaxID=3154651 RepID=UPI00342DB672